VVLRRAVHFTTADGDFRHLSDWDERAKFFYPIGMAGGKRHEEIVVIDEINRFVSCSVWLQSPNQEIAADGEEEIEDEETELGVELIRGRVLIDPDIDARGKHDESFSGTWPVRVVKGGDESSSSRGY